MNIFSIRDIENLTGIKAHTLRIWERRYGIILPPTAPGKHRMYDSNDLKHILRISSLYHKGIKISKIAEMSFEEIRDNTTTIDARSNFEAFISKLAEYTIDSNEVAFKRLMSELRETMGDVNMYMHVIFPFLTRLGGLWLNDKIIPLQEHFASNIIRNELLIAIDQSFSPKKRGPRVMLFCPPDEHHEIPLLFCNLMLRTKKIDTIYLGANTGDDLLTEVVSKTDPDWIMIYLITNFISQELNSYVDSISSKYPGRKLMLCGPGFKDVQPLSGDISVCRGINELVNFCLNL